MDNFLLILIFILGLGVGSFLNCLIYRLEKKDSFFSGRSYCPKCHHQLSWFDLIPLFSFLFLKGRCAYCGEKISWQYPLVELATGTIFLLIFSSQLPISDFRDLSNLFYLLLISGFLIIIFVYDFKYYLIPDKIIYPAILISLFYRIFENWNLKFEIWNFLLGAFIISGFFLAIYLLSQGKAIGFGDLKLGFLMGLILGWPLALIALWLAFLIGGPIALILVALRKKGWKSEIPLGPFLVLATFLAILAGNQIINLLLPLKG